jgi:hypothetical protein
LIRDESNKVLKVADKPTEVKKKVIEKVIEIDELGSLQPD